MFDALAKAAVGALLLPVDIASDVVTMGGELTDSRAATPKRLKQIGRALDRAVDCQE
ncbi:MAG: hypothetical protein V2I27_04695 [Erythrobacter sp.]|jgi:hypothetical protein|nr:hypothetical protein [Erythrobacter sp.]